jgi:hypothetical protein
VSIYEARLREALRVLEVHSPTEFSWRGERSQRLSRKVSAALAPETARAFLISNIQETLYADFYMRGGVRPGRDKTSNVDLPGRTEFVERLSAANTGRGYLVDKWVVRRYEPDAMVVHRNGLDLWVKPEECVPTNGHEDNTEETVALWFPKEHLTFSPGFYVALSDATSPERQTDKILRLYWNLREGGAEPFIRATTTILNQVGVDFKAKVLRNPGMFTRCDAGVLYLPRSDYFHHRQLIANIHTRIAPSLRRRLPVFTKPLAHGLALAEDTGTGRSFGMDRCRLIAKGAVRAHEHTARSLHDRVSAVADCFVEAGLDFDRPYLAPGSTDDYELGLRTAATS